MEKLGEVVFAANEIYSEHLDINYLENEDANKKCESCKFFAPGELSSFEQQNPLQVIVEFFAFKTYEEWDECLKHIRFFALCSADPAETGFKEDTMTIFEKIMKLINACHIIFAGFKIG